MATVHLGRWVSDHGLGRLVAVKRRYDPDGAFRGNGIAG